VNCARRREANRGGEAFEDSKDLGPVFDPSPSSLRRLFHPSVSTVLEVRCVVISAMLNLG